MRGNMVLPTREEISTGTTRTFVNKNDVERFDDYMNSVDGVVFPLVSKANDCDMRQVIEESHVAETSLELLNTEILRMLFWTKADFKPDVERLARKYKDTDNLYKEARNTFQYKCQCTKRK